MPSFSSLAVLWTLLPMLAGGAVRPKILSPAEVGVVAMDYAFAQVPARIASGPTVFSFANHGKVQHEMSIFRLSAGASVEQAMKAIRDGRSRKGLVERSVGLLIAGPGKSPDGRILVDLLPGTTYLVLCNLKDSPDASSHLMLGMFTSFRTE